jgi:hypothetical protein
MERSGVFGVGQIVERDLRWIFREQHEQDYGIDAHIEVCNSEGPTGRLIAAQIKAGKSYFRQKVKDFTKGTQDTGSIITSL